MSYDSIDTTVFVVLGVLGLLGGIPQILRWAKPKPHLRITEAKIVRLPNENYKFRFHLEIENERVGWKRNGDASDVGYEFYVVDKESVQRGSASAQAVTQLLLAGFKTRKETEVFLSLPPDGNPYTVVFRVTCREGDTFTKKWLLTRRP